MQSSSQDIFALASLVDRTGNEIARLRREGKRVHMIWDFDFVLAFGLSEDVFDLSGRDIAKFLEYENRLCLESLRKGPWLRLALQAGSLHQSQDIVTARAGIAGYRAMVSCIEWSPAPDFIRATYCVGQQPKRESFRAILSPLRDENDVHVFFVDDTPEVALQFDAVAEEMGMGAQTRSIVSPRLREYTRADLENHYDAVMSARGEGVVLVPHWRKGHSSFHVVPSGARRLRDIVLGNQVEVFKEGFVDRHRSALRKAHARVRPEKEASVQELYALAESALL